MRDWEKLSQSVKQKHRRLCQTGGVFLFKAKKSTNQQEKFILAI